MFGRRHQTQSINSSSLPSSHYKRANGPKRTRRQLRLEGLERRELFAGLIADAPVYQGLAIQRPDDRYDLQPTILYDPTDTHDANQNGIPDRLYTMAWLGRYAPGDADLAPANLNAGDRIYTAFSEDGQHWGTPTVALKGLGGTGGLINADDHLVGSPSLLKVNGKYYMFYEAYSTWATPINRFFSFSRGDNWVTNGVDLPAPGNPEGYQFERNMGFAPLLVKAGTHPVYSGEAIYNLPTGPKHNHYLTKAQPFVGQRDNATWIAHNQGQPVYWLYDQPAVGRKAIYSFWDGVHSNTYATDDPNGDGVAGATLVEILGYAADRLDGPDMIGAMQNRIMMATSSDGEHWTRFAGPARGGAVITPQNELTTVYNPQTWQLNQAYGSGYPSALVRDNILELYFTDEDSVAGTDLRRVRIPLERIEDPNAWRDARAVGNPSLSQFAAYGSDIKWSVALQRYFVSYVKNLTPQITNPDDPNFRQSATILWSDANPDPSVPATFPAANAIELPSGGRVAIWGGLLGDGLGHTREQLGSEIQVALDSYFESYLPGTSHVFDTDIAHASVKIRMQNSTPPTAEISIDGVTDGQTAPVDFGSTFHGGSNLRKTFTVRNEGGAPLYLGQLQLPQFFQLVEGLVAVLQPGASDTFTVELVAPAPGTYGGQILLPTSDADENPYDFNVLGRVESAGVPDIEISPAISPAPIDFGTVLQGASGPTRSFVVRNVGTAPLHITSVVIPNGFKITNSLASTLLPGTGNTLTIQLKTDVVGTFSGLVRILSNDPDENALEFAIQGRVAAVPAPEIDVLNLVDGQTAVVDFGAGVRSQVGPSMTFTVRNTGSAALSLGAISVPSGFEVTEGLPASLAAGASNSFTVRLKTTQLGQFQGQISITNNDADESPFNFPVKGVVVSFAGREITVDGILDGQSTSIDFGSIKVGAVAPTRTFTVRNDGSTNLSLGQVTLPTGFSVAKALPVSLRPGQSDTLVIRMNTTVAGSFGGQISIVNNDTNENPFNFPVRGQVVAPAPEIVVTLGAAELSGGSGSAVLGTAYQNSTSPVVQLRIQNRGDRDLLLDNWILSAGFRFTNSRPTRVLPGGSVSVSVALDVTTIGIKEGTLRFSSNDADEASFVIQLRGKVYTPVRLVSGSAAQPVNGVYSITVAAGAQVSLDLPNGNMPSNGRYVVTYGGTRITIDGTLTRLRIRGTTKATVDNWTNVAVEFA